MSQHHEWGKQNVTSNDLNLQPRDGNGNASDLLTAERHLGWALEIVKQQVDEVADLTAKGALATAAADLEHVRLRVQRIMVFAAGRR